MCLPTSLTQHAFGPCHSSTSTPTPYINAPPRRYSHSSDQSSPHVRPPSYILPLSISNHQPAHKMRQACSNKHTSTHERKMMSTLVSNGLFILYANRTFWHCAQADTMITTCSTATSRASWSRQATPQERAKAETRSGVKSLLTSFAED